MQNIEIFRSYRKPLFSCRIIDEGTINGLNKNLENPRKFCIELQEDEASTLDLIAMVSGLPTPDYVRLIILIELNTLVSTEESKRKIMVEAGDDPDEE